MVFLVHTELRCTVNHTSDLPMKILQRNLNRSTFVVWEMKRNVPVARFKFRCNILIGGKIIEEMPGSVARDTHCVWVLENDKQHQSSELMSGPRLEQRTGRMRRICITFIDQCFGGTSWRDQEMCPILGNLKFKPGCCRARRLGAMGRVWVRRNANWCFLDFYGLVQKWVNVLRASVQTAYDGWIDR